MMLNRWQKGLGRAVDFPEKLGCIQIGDNVFIGSGTRVLGGVRIGSNCVVGAGTLVVEDIPDNSVVAGVPAKVIGSIDEFIEKRLKEERYPEEYRPAGEQIKPELAELLWSRFQESREKV